MIRASYCLPDASALGEFLQRNGWMIACAESCTGGLLAAALTDTPGSSVWFDRGLVTYSNGAKMQLLGVHPDTLERFGAVSEETAMEMAAGVLSTCDTADFAVSTTGIAGPGGATPGKPVGTVWLAIAARGAAPRAELLQLGGDRTAVRAQTVRHALARLCELAAPGPGAPRAGTAA